MAGGNTDLRNILIAIACNVEAMNEAAGGVARGGANDREFNILLNIACDLSSTLNALGGTAIQINASNELGLWQTIQCQTAALTTATGTGLNAGNNTNTMGAVQGIVCNLEQVATNIGADPVEVVANDYIPALESIICLTAAIAEHGFSPPDPVQAFINSLLPFAPDLLIVADTFVGAGGDPVPSAPDSSGNNNPMTNANAPKQPTLSVAAVNGKNAYNFAASQFLQCPFSQVGATDLCSVLVFARNGPGGNRAATTFSGFDGPDAAGNTPIFTYLSTDVPSSFYGGTNIFGGPAIADTNFHIATAWITAATTAHFIFDGVAIAPVPGTSNVPQTGAEYAAIGGRADGFALLGKIAFHARWLTTPSDADILAFNSLVEAYYGL